MPKKQLIGKVISNKMQKTIVIEVERIKEHSKYKRRYRIRKKYKAHTNGENYNIGDKVIIEECIPKSKDKKWCVIEKIQTKAEKEKKEPENSVVEENNKQKIEE